MDDSYYIDRSIDYSGPHETVGLGNTIYSTLLARGQHCQEEGCEKPVCGACWECERFYCFDHAVEHSEQRSQNT